MTADEDKIRRFMQSQFLFEFDGTVGRESDLFRLGLIDSFGFIELVSFLESEFHLTFTEEELVSGALSTLENMVVTVRRKSHG